MWVHACTCTSNQASGQVNVTADIHVALVIHGLLSSDYLAHAHKICMCDISIHYNFQAISQTMSLESKIVEYKRKVESTK